ncbi:MAG: NAD(P)/FAD-dependent oxidoreductase [Aquabacterium sp.]|nr:NAD(P)/FAD-dependent oxidoreductase [Aquabacterium sp.]
MQTTAAHRAAATEVLIIGTGFGGIGMAIRLKQAGIDDVVLLERGDDVGGCWRDNTYPGAACDVPSHLYSFSFEPKSDWSRRYAPQAEILAYLRGCADKHGLRSRIHTGEEVSELRWDAATSLWQATTRDGRIWRARFVVTACGQLSRPLIPRIEGLGDFAGPQFHSAIWRHDVDLTGKRVAVIGTGASAIQFIPQIARRAAQVTVFQRTPPYVIPKQDRPYARWEQRLFARVPGARLATRGWLYVSHEWRALAFTRYPALLKVAQWDALRRLRAQVADQALRRKLTPGYPIGCKRVLLSNDFLPALQRPNVELVTEAIRRVTPAGVQTADGRLHQADVLIHGTGFAATEFLTPMTVHGRDGHELNADWKDGAEAFLGISVPGYPNFFMLYGPNTNLGHSSIVYMLESQIAHVLGCLRRVRREGAATIEVRPQAHRAFNDTVQQHIRRTVWDGGCRSWYLTESGRNTVNWPGFTFVYRRLAGRLKAGDYQLASG